MTLLMGILCLIISLSACTIARNLERIADILHAIDRELANQKKMDCDKCYKLDEVLGEEKE